MCLYSGLAKFFVHVSLKSYLVVECEFWRRLVIDLARRLLGLVHQIYRCIRPGLGNFGLGISEVFMSNDDAAAKLFHRVGAGSPC